MESHHRCFAFVTSLIHSGSHMSPTKSLFDVGSRRISIFIVSTFVSLGCSAIPSRIMRGLLKSLLVVTVFICCRKAVDGADCLLFNISILGGMDKSKITRKQSKASKHGHENQKSTKPKPQKPNYLALNPLCPLLDQTVTNEAQMIKEMILGQDCKIGWQGQEFLEASQVL
ncbi:hypothetical protein Tco_1093910 [Tanacetum coccineum]|uniref:Uncharacterized protein n=1 Tax=Tanacetum coccineum TaxID=301880 RepID=A0ABQ5IGF7_9ASTR